MYYDLFKNKADICREFAIEGFDGEVLYARYEYEDYLGDAAVVFVHQGKFYLSAGSHCSCMGLEDQWSPEETTVAMMRHILEHGSVHGFTKEAFRHVLDALEEMGLEEEDDETISTMMRLRY